MTATKLQKQTPITDAEGRPSNYFIKQWNRLTSAVGLKAGLTAGTYGDALNVAKITVNEFGIITAVEEEAIVGAAGTSHMQVMSRVSLGF